MGNDRRRVLYSGHVQGVGFRWTAQRTLQGLPVTGYVRNLADGRVELVVEGAPEQTEAACARLRGAMRAHIAGEECELGSATGEFEGFSIRR
jgi:acylphosphatase